MSATPNLATKRHNRPAEASSKLARRLRREIAGDVLFDRYSRARYATDASPYQVFPLGVVLPKTQDDVIAAVNIAREAGVPITARGGGTGLAGQAIGEGLILDFSKYLTRLLYFDTQARTCIVEPGISLAALNAALRPEKLWFPVDIGSASTATIGGMAATDAMGARALLYGRMRDNVAAVDAVLPSGAEVSFGEVDGDFGHDMPADASSAIMLDLMEIAESRADAIRALPKYIAAQPGYNVSPLLHGEGPQNLAAFFTGSEGTLAIARRIELKLARRPRNRALGVCQFPSVPELLAAVPDILTLAPTAMELADRYVMELGFMGLAPVDPARRLMRRDTGACLFVEFMEGNSVANAKKLKDLAEVMLELGFPRAVNEVMGAAVQNATWGMRRKGLTRLFSNTATNPLLSPIEEFALPIEHLEAAAEQMIELLKRHRLNAVWHGHVGVGGLHLRPWLHRGDNPGDAATLVREASAILRDFAGSLASSQGHGIARSAQIEALRDPAITELFEQLKMRLDPHNLFNPGKIVFPAFADEPALWRRHATSENPLLADALGCEANGRCRKLVDDIMCPSFRVTREERDSPRGRANTLRLALSGELGEDALASPEMAETMQSCVSCKACKNECPNAVDIASAKIAVQEARAEKYGLTRFQHAMAFLPHTAPRLRQWRHFLNLRDILPWGARLSERLTGFSADRPWPRWHARPFRDGEVIGPENGQEILLFLDTFNNYFDAGTLRAGADVLAASGYRVIPLVPPENERPYCCGRTFLEAGLVDQARQEAQRLITATAPFIARGVRLLGLEPSCLLTIREEFRNMLRVTGADELAAKSMLFEEIMTQSATAKAIKPHLREIEANTLCFGHCHQSAHGSAPAAKAVAALVPGLQITEGNKTCCGMGTAFGYDPKNVALSLQMGEASLFPQIRGVDRDTLLIADGFSCRTQILHGTGRNARHTAVLLKLALAAQEQIGAAPESERTEKAHANRLKQLKRQYFR